jgi:hypothetical protein
MFHCTIDDEYIVLLDPEAREILSDATGDPGRALTYNMLDSNGKKRSMDKNCDVIMQRLHKLKSEDVELFRKNYCFRSKWGEESIYALFPLIDGYRRLFSWADIPEVGNFAEALAMPGSIYDYVKPDIITLCLQSRAGFLRRKCCTILTWNIPTDSIEHVFGTTKSIVMMLEAHKIVFSELGIEIESRAKKTGG